MPNRKRRPFVVRRSPIHGRGAFATRPIPAGTRLIEYAGQRLTPTQADARYPDPHEFQALVREWIPGQDDDPARDQWGSPILLEVEGVYYELVSCGHDTVCGTPDDIRHRGGY